MEQARQYLDGSLVWRAVDALSEWAGRQWQNSRIVQWFLHPAGWTKAASESSIFYRLWLIVLGAMRWVYAKLHLDRLFRGSIFNQVWFWCAIPAVIAPVFCVWRDSLVVLALCFVGCASLLLSLVRNRNRTLTWSPINRYIILYCAVYTVGIFFSVDLKLSLQPGLLTVGLTIFSLALYNAVQRRSQLDTLINLILVAALFISIFGILQYIFKWGYQSSAWVDSDMFSSIRFRVSATLDNPNMLGQYLILVIPLGGAKLLSSRDWPTRIFWFCSCGAMCLCMILTFSRGAWLGLLFAGAVFFIFWHPQFILLVPFALVAMLFVLPQSVIERFTSIGNLSDASTSYRVYIWMGTLAMLKDYWLCGIGPGTEAFNLVYPAYSYDSIAAPHSHNLFLQIVCDVGICALIVFVILLFVFFRMMCSGISREKNPDSRLLQIAITAGTAGFMVQAMTDFSFYNNRLMLFFWVYLVLGALAVRREKLAAGGVFETQQ